MEESLPNITGHFYSTQNSNKATGAFIGDDVDRGSTTYGASGTGVRKVTFNASLSSPTYQDNAHVRPLSIATAFLIRY